MSRSPDRPRTPWWYPSSRKLAALFLVLALIGGGAWLGWDRTHCAPGIRRLGPECIGVTDGSFAFPETGADLTAVMEKIHEENRRVEQTGEPYVSVAYLVPLPREAEGLSEVLRRELQGAHLAQRLANRTDELGDLPLIRLLVANAGEDNNHWRPVVAQLLGLIGSDRLVAVAGLGQSRDTTFQAIRELTAAQIPAIASNLTADDDLSRINGLVRVTPANTDQVKAAVVYLKRDPAISRALLIQDSNAADPFARTLGDAFRREFPDATHSLLGPVEEYDGSLSAVADRFTQMMASICRQEPDIVFFAGRGADLEAFIEVLPRRPCPDFHVNVMTGDSAGNLSTEETRPGLEFNVTLRYTAHAHPDAWAAAPQLFSPAPIRYFTQDCVDPNGNCLTSLFPNELLDVESVIMGHDTIVTAVKAIRPPDQENVTIDPIALGEVIQRFGGLHDEFAVPGASGWISLDSSGIPVDKAIPILELLPDGSKKFVELSSPSPSETPFTPP
ncbi:MAG: ABC transporter substrate-binding protein [Egibacteraceae bacterium]